MKKFDKIDKYHFLWAVGLSVFGCILLFISLLLPIRGEITTSVITAVGMLFTFSGTIVGINGSVNTKLARFEQDFKEKKEDMSIEVDNQDEKGGIQ